MMKKRKVIKKITRRNRSGKFADDRAIVISTPEGIKRYTMLSQYHAAKLEGLGLKHSSGRSVLAHIKKTYKLKGSREEVLKTFRGMIDKIG
jgi:hypothetical protein